MPYNINKYNNDLAATVEDGTVDNSLDIKLIGKNYAGYGEVQNENFVFLLENFAGTVEPPKKITGQIWFDANTSKLKFFDGTKFRTTGGAEIGDAAPSGLTTGDFWFNTATNQLLAWDGAQFQLIGPQAVADADTTQLRSRSLVDVSDNIQPVIEAVVDGVTVYIISPTEFTIKNTVNSIAGFSTIKKGITLINTPNVTGGSDVQGVTGTDYRFWGTSSNAERLGGIAAANFVRNDISSLPTVAIRFSDLGYTVGDDNDIAVYIEGTTPVFENQLSSTIEFRTNPIGSGTQVPLKLVGANVFPGDDNACDIGSPTARYSSIYAVSFEGTATTADAVNVGGNARQASTSDTGNTIAARTVDGDLAARLFIGTATEAYYADLAEKYLADAEYSIGTVVMIGGEKEITSSKSGRRAIGAVSAHPAFLMNKGLEGGTTVALKGRVPVKVVGAVKKGDELIAADNGCATTAIPLANGVFAIALESNDDTGVKLVEALVL